MNLWEAQTTRIDVNGVHPYATPLLQVQAMLKLQISREVVMKNLRNTEKRSAQDSQHASTYQEEIKKLDIAEHVAKIDSCKADTSIKSHGSWPNTWSGTIAKIRLCSIAASGSADRV